MKKTTWRYHYFTPVYHRYWWYDLHFLRYEAWQTEIDNFGSYFALLPHLKYQNFEKIKKKLPEMLFCTCVPKSQLCFLRYRDGKNFLSFWGIFYPSTPPPLKSLKIKILKNWNKHLKISSFYTSVPKITVIWWMLPDIPSVTDNFLSFCQFLAIFCPLLPNNRDIGLLILGKCSLGGKMEGLCKLVTVTKKNKNVCKL